MVAPIGVTAERTAGQCRQAESADGMDDLNDWLKTQGGRNLRNGCGWTSDVTEFEALKGATHRAEL